MSMNHSMTVVIIFLIIGWNNFTWFSLFWNTIVFDDQTMLYGFKLSLSLAIMRLIRWEKTIRFCKTCGRKVTGAGFLKVGGVIWRCRSTNQSKSSSRSHLHLSIKDQLALSMHLSASLSLGKATHVFFSIIGNIGNVNYACLSILTRLIMGSD